MSSFDTRKVVNMSAMFYNCNSLVYLNLSNFIIISIPNLEDMFGYCTSLKKLNINKMEFFENQNHKNMFNKIKFDTEIIVKDSTVKSWFNTNFSNLTNVIVG